MVDALPRPRTLLAQSPGTIVRKLRSRLWSTRRSITVVLDLPPAAPSSSSYGPLDVAFAEPTAVPVLTGLAPDTTGSDLLTLAAIERTRAAAAGEVVIARRAGAFAGVHFIHTAADQERLEAVAPGLYQPLAEDEALTEGLFVVPALRRQGVAPTMLQATGQELARRGYHRALAVIDVDNRASLRAFAAAGFQPGPTMRVDRVRLGRRSSQFVTLPPATRRRYAAAVGTRRRGRPSPPTALPMIL